MKKIFSLALIISIYFTRSKLKHPFNESPTKENDSMG